MKHFRIGGLEGMAQHPGHPTLQTLLQSTFLWRYIKDRIYATPVADCDELKASMQAAVGSVTEHKLQNIWREVEYHLYVLRATKKAHIEIY